MTEPRSKAERIVPVVAGIYRWSVSDDRIGGAESDAYAVEDTGRVVLIDPLPVDEQELSKLGTLSAIVLSAGNHQRSAWRYRRLFRIPVYAPENAYRLEEQPDVEYTSGDSLPVGLAALHTPGPAIVMYALWRARPRGVVFLSDLLAHDGSGVPSFLESEYQDDPARTRMSVRRILERLPVEVLCFNHGPPILQDGAEALRAALRADTEFPELHVP